MAFGDLSHWHEQFINFFLLSFSLDCGNCVDTSIIDCYAKKPIKCCVNSSGEIVNICNQKEIATTLQVTQAVTKQRGN